jgi:hypothetical protein
MDKPAFPTWSAKDVVQGMTLRDYFAATALQGMLSDPNVTIPLEKISAWAYKYADAMMEARDVA